MLTVGCGGFVAFGAIGIWTGDDKFFENLIVPFLNRIDPEMSHKAAVIVAKYHLTRAAPHDNPPNLVKQIFNSKATLLLILYIIHICTIILNF